MIRSSGILLVSCIGLLGLLCDVATAQQFLEETSRLPSQSFYSNQLSACDFDMDGDMDFVVADGPSKVCAALEGAPATAPRIFDGAPRMFEPAEGDEFDELDFTL